MRKSKRGFSVGPDIRKLIEDNNFTKFLSATEAAAWASFKIIQMGVRMLLKIHFLYSHLNFFPDYLSDTSDEQGEMLHQDLQKIEKNYYGKNSIAV